MRTSKQSMIPWLALTHRQRDVLRLLQSPSTWAEIAARLGVGIGTVRRHTQDAKRRAPTVYATVMRRRVVWRARRHQVALDRQRARTTRFYRRMRSRARRLGLDWREIAPPYVRRS